MDREDREDREDTVSSATAPTTTNAAGITRSSRGEPSSDTNCAFTSETERFTATNARPAVRSTVDATFAFASPIIVFGLSLIHI